MAGAALQGDKLSVFISCGRDDLDFADQLRAALLAFGYVVTMDRHSIPGGDEWEKRLSRLIADSHTVVFALSPSSADSKFCKWEVEEAVRLGKRVLPVACRAPGTRFRTRTSPLSYEAAEAMHQAWMRNREIALAGHRGSVRTAAFSPDGKHVVTASWDNKGRVWRLFPEVNALIAEVRPRLSRCLSQARRDAFGLHTEHPVDDRTFIPPPTADGRCPG